MARPVPWEADAEVIATCRAPDMAFVAGLGAQAVIDVDAADFVASAGPIDLVLDTVGGDRQHRSFDVVPPGGALVSIVSPPDQRRAAERGVRSHYFIVDVRRPVLEEIASRLAAGTLVANIGEVLALAEVELAHQMLAGRSHRGGKIVLDIRS